MPREKGLPKEKGLVMKIILVGGGNIHCVTQQIPRG